MILDSKLRILWQSHGQHSHIKSLNGFHYSTFEKWAEQSMQRAYVQLLQSY